MSQNMSTERRMQTAEVNRTYIKPLAKRGLFSYGSAVSLLVIVLILSLTVLLGMYAALNHRNDTLQAEMDELLMKNESLRAEQSALIAEATVANDDEPEFVHALVNSDTKYISNCRSEYAILIDTQNHTVIAEKNGDDRIYPASMTKVMTLIVAAEYLTDLDNQFMFTYAITDPAYQAGASVAGFLNEESVPMIDILYGVALPSGADATTAVAMTVAGTEEAFAELMNKKAEEMGLTNTHFMNASGLHDSDHYSTPHEMAIIFEYAMKIPLVAEILSTYQYTTTSTEQHPDGILLTSTMFSRMYGDEAGNCEVIAGKTGYTNEGRQCLASMAETPDGRRYILVTAKAQNKYDPVYDAIDIYKNYIPDME